MKVFLLLYAGPSPKLTDLPLDQAQATVDSWKQWGYSLGQATIQVGMPFLDRVELGSNGVQQKDLSLNGYTIIQAEDMTQAITLAQNHPYLANNDGTRAIDIYELMTEPPTTYARRQGLIQATPASEVLPQPSSTLPPAAPEPPQNPGELTIPHETADEEQPPVPPQPPGQNPL